MLQRLKRSSQGGTSGIGASVAHALASRGAQLVLLVPTPLTDPFLAEQIMDLRAATGNELITAEHVDLASLHSIRRFATKWVDNAPPRRLDMLVLCGGTMTPARSAGVQVSEDGVEINFAVNYLANFHLLSILSPAIRAQPPDRDVRVLFATCSSYMGGALPPQVPLPGSVAAQGATAPSRRAVADPAAAYATSKLALMTFACAFQKHLAAYKRPDGQPSNARVLLVDPGWSRTPGMRRYLAGGSLWGLLAYLVLWPVWWLVLKSAEQGAQTFMYAAMEAEYGRGNGGVLLKECREVKVAREEIADEEKQKSLWELSERAVEALEKAGALKRAQEKTASEGAEAGAAEGAEPVNGVQGEDKGDLSTEKKTGRMAGSRRSKKT